MIIMTYVQLNETELINHVPKVAVMNEFNQITQMKDIMNSDNLYFFSKVFFFQKLVITLFIKKSIDDKSSKLYNIFMLFRT